jgi:hypothetical protein
MLFRAPEKSTLQSECPFCLSVILQTFAQSQDQRNEHEKKSHNKISQSVER